MNKRFPLGIRETAPSLTLQVDNGCQPTSRSFVNTVKRCSIDLAFTAIATPEHNAIIERFFRTLKEECIWPNLFESFEEAVKEIGDYIQFYNSERIHSALGYLSPECFVKMESLRNIA
jgi:putative transposase